MTTNVGHINFSKVREIAEALDLDPYYVKSINITASAVTIIGFEQDENGQRILVHDDFGRDAYKKYETMLRVIHDE